jgi:hypothetical protein
MFVTAESSETTERLEAEVCTLAGQIAAATCRFVLLIAELDRREAWKEWGCASMAHWLSWKCALSMTAAREHVRVGRALEELRLTTTAFAEGRLSYSKVRALVRVAKPEREAELIEFAETATASQLERTIGTYTRQCVERDAERDNLDRIRLRLFANGDGTGDLAGRLTAEQFSLLKQALEAAEREVPRTTDDSAESRRANALELIVRSFLAGNSDRVPTEVVLQIDDDDIRAGEISGAGERFLCDTSVRLDVRDGDKHEIGSRTRTIPRRLRRLLQRRDKGGCRFPGCSHTRFLHVHHLVHYAQRGATNSENCILLCWLHHKFVHEGGWQVWGDGDKLLFFMSPKRKVVSDCVPPLGPQELRPIATITSGTIQTALGDRFDHALAVHVVDQTLQPV